MIIKDFVAFQTIFLLATSNGKTEKNFKCYVCVSKPILQEVKDIFSNWESLPLCKQFRPEKDYERTCPSKVSDGCLTQTDGTRITKMCSEGGYQDCRSANKIKYCYCKGQLCNNETASVLLAEVAEANDGPLRDETTVDDEDSIFPEGSGSYLVESDSETISPREDSIKPTLGSNGFRTTERSFRFFPSNGTTVILPTTTFLFLLLFLVHACILNIRKIGLL